MEMRVCGTNGRELRLTVGGESLKTAGLLSLHFYKNLKVLVTGNSGFKGCWLSLWLSRLGARVHGLSNSEPTPMFEAISDCLASHTVGDVRNPAAVEELIVAKGIDIVFHLAAQAIVGVGQLEPMETFSVNVMGTAAVLEGVRRARGDIPVVVVTSDKVYENSNGEVSFDENARLGGTGIYAASKACAELLTKAWSSSYQMPAVVTVRAGNVIGGGDFGQNRLLPDCMRALSAGRPIRVRHPTHTRPWQYVLDCVYGYLLAGAAARERAGQSFNFGPEASESVNVFIDKAIRFWGQGSVESAEGTFSEDSTLSLNSMKARTVLGWRPMLDFDNAMNWSVAWYRQHYQGGKVGDFSRLQIEQFTEVPNWLNHLTP